MSIEEPETLEELAQYLKHYRKQIAVRAQVNGRWGSYFLSELSPSLEREHVDRFISGGRIPVRVSLEPSSSCDESSVAEQGANGGGGEGVNSSVNAAQTQTQIDIARSWMNLCKRTGEDDPVVPITESQWSAVHPKEKRVDEAGVHWVTDMRVKVAGSTHEH